MYALQLASLPITFRAILLGFAMAHLSVVLIVEVRLPAYIAFGNADCSLLESVTYFVIVKISLWLINIIE